jgi:hypothetical protein
MKNDTRECRRSLGARRCAARRHPSAEGRITGAQSHGFEYRRERSAFIRGLLLILVFSAL